MVFQYNAPTKDWNPWVNYNNPKDNPTYNNTMDPYYSAGADSQRWGLAQTGAAGETNQARVWRWTLDDLHRQGLDPGAADQGVVRQAYLNNIGRLHRDYAVNNFDWGKSGYAGYDKFLATSPGNMPGGPPPTDPSGKPLPVDPNTGRPTTNTKNGGLGAGTPAPTPSPQTNAPPPVPNPGMGGGAANGGLSGAGASVLSQDPSLTYQYMMRQLGFDPTAPSRFGQFLEKRFSPILQANLAAQAIQQNGNQSAQYMDQFGQNVNNFGAGLFQQGGNFFGNQANVASQALQNPAAMDFLGGIQEQAQVEQYLNQLATLKYAGANPMIQQSVADTLDRNQKQYDYTAFNQVNQGQSAGDPYLTWLRNNPVYNKYLGVR